MQRSAIFAGFSKGTGPASRPGRCLALAGLLVVSALAGCAARPQDILSATTAQRKPLEDAMVDMPPGGPAIIGVVERNYANSTTQEVVLANRSHTPGQNTLQITMFGPVKIVTGPENVRPNDPLATMNWAREIRDALPGVPMQVSNLYAQNRYGSFGYATGRTPSGDTCLYAWQRIRAPDLDSTMISDQGTIAIRLRLCEPRASEMDLLTVMTGFNINAYFLASRWNPYGTAPPPPEELGLPGETVLPPAEAFEKAPAPVRRTVVRPVAAADTVYGGQSVIVPATTSVVTVPATTTLAPAITGTVVPPPTIVVPTPTIVAKPAAPATEAYPLVPPP